MSLFDPEDSTEALTTAALQMAWPQEPVTFEDVAVTFSPEQWASLESGQRSLYRRVMLDNYALVAALAASPACKPALIARLERGEALWNSEALGSGLPGAGNWVMKEELDLEPEADAEMPGAQPGSATRSVSSAGQAAGANPNLILRGGMKFYRCRDCGKIFRYNSKLLRHQMSHSGEKPFPCGECGKAFKSRYDCGVHEKNHAGQGPYECAECGRGLSSSTALTQHRRIHTGERPYACPQCGRAFRRSAAFLQHRRLHTGEQLYHCRECRKAFGCRSLFMAHQRVHTGERPFRCPQCGKAFAQKVAAAQHQRVHTGERPYACEVCGKAFRWHGSLLQHRRLHSTDRPSGVHRRSSQGPAPPLVPVLVPQGSQPALAMAPSSLAFAHSLLIPASGPVLLLLPASGSPESPRALLPPVQIMHVIHGLGVPAKGAPPLLPPCTPTRPSAEPPQPGGV
ncbi:zinc finger protein 621 isoform X1 [Octodon degus]|uniref:Zinc finger protein 621 isoform X1 n=2 Tax=Octodon degus TaxID=10160 RepID=A0A6P6D9M5_OCTDE|nr:zinc finger protein 621 isoform X1 [Octodon degus]XP_023556580.1 zinc finger protein 621 isoform X1 [Octodon degus]XP_023556581.1 zinc finger protein 621 isoform X1 [Octodon degus]